MHNPPLILIADDDKDFLEVLATKFKAGGFEVQTAFDGAEMVQKAQAIIPDLILSDVKMPKMDGVGALLKLKEDARTKGVKVVLLTAFGDPQPEFYRNDQRFAQELGAIEYLLKTQELDEIVNRVKAVLGTH
jgi:CheY-like chemotaxis protein